MERLLIAWPRQFENSFENCEFIFKVLNVIKESEKKYVILDFSKTKTFATNLLSIVYVLVEENDNKEIRVLLPNGKVYFGKKILMEIFDAYAKDTRSFYKPRVVVGNENLREEEDLLLKYLLNIKLKNYDKIKTLLSELMANIKMHVRNIERETRGYLAAAYNDDGGKKIVISITNSYRTILTALKLRGYEFANNTDAILWALKKSNSSRDDKETGGIGLYLLRKYIYQLRGEAIIISGDGYIKLDSSCYQKDNENAVVPMECRNLKNEFVGMIVTLCIPYEVKEQDVHQKLEDILLDIMEV